MLMCPDPGCSGHGSCSEGICTCVAGFTGPSCAEIAGGCVPPCTGNGFCNPISKKCECAVGATGPDCGTSLGECPNQCSSKGLCLNGQCMCGPGWQGKDCSKRYFAPGAPLTQVKKAGGDKGGASGGGGDEGGQAAIVGLGGSPAPPEEALAEPAAGQICGEGGLCSGHGTCNTEAGVCDCEKLYSGEVCQIQHCPGFADAGEDCYGHGLCSSGACDCAAGWGLAPHKTTVNACQDRVCLIDCGDHGSCANGECVCQQGWQGPNCAEPQCPDDCSGHGQCTFVSANGPGQCACDYGWGGAACHRGASAVEMRKCANDCSGNGLCLDGKCMCNVGWRGADCRDPICGQNPAAGPACGLETCPRDCTGKGLCMSGTCVCWEGFQGHDCAIPTLCWEPCHLVCGADSLAEKCMYCVGQCTTLQRNPNIGSHNPFEDLQSTLLQLGAGSAPRQAPRRRHREVSAVHLGGA